MTTTSGAATDQVGSTTPPGRLGDPNMTLRDDPRSDPRMVAALAAFGLDGAQPPPPVDADSPREAQLAYLAETEAGFEALFATFIKDLPPVDGVGTSTETITGVDGNDLTLFISRPSGATGPLPGILHIHGGGMVILSAAGPAYRQLREEIAATGVVVIGVEYRNGAGALGPYPFPAGLDDCTTALEWVHARRGQLGISTLTVAGESGGANLSLATTLRAKRDGRLDMIDGVYAMVPYISGAYAGADADRPRELPSLVENDGYFISCARLAVMARVYDPDGAHTTDPLAWPYHASDDDLRGLPPHVISVCEVDPLRDEGLAYHRALHRAGVSTVARTVPGACHAGDLIFHEELPEIYRATVASIHAFVAGG